MAGRRRVGSPDEEIVRIIQMKAKKLTRCPEYRDDDPDDIAQDLHVKWLQIRGHHDASRGSVVTFADVSLNNHIRNMIESRRTLRGGGRSTAPSEAGPSASGSKRPTPVQPSSEDRDDDRVEIDVETISLRIDVRRALRKLRPDLRRIAERLGEDGVTGIAKAAKLSRTTVYKRIRELRQILTDLGLDDYLR